MLACAVLYVLTVVTMLCLMVHTQRPVIARYVPDRQVRILIVQLCNSLPFYYFGLTLTFLGARLNYENSFYLQME